ncbi:hypothetical protein CC1G_14499 [Coprinopsis cinerea okayama7|uniref:Uncharacterized protein n=1 Tax=Coprinopsis cinerea (strain Okayama-7 / 130 / ATCC MYA-4618 / FGSC 9003) TaxID=240176 RepID=D6RLV9_COPC7|nr:hypothetical protein CC1G_14499 [Coprinopsis cinerea okayama7\|eukprot:XP_002911501.1 hypothetical protein CC1G_14499 [Coprinopsis cinerea okayama7\
MSIMRTVEESHFFIVFTERRCRTECRISKRFAVERALVVAQDSGYEAEGPFPCGQSERLPVRRGTQISGDGTGSRWRPPVWQKGCVAFKVNSEAHDLIPDDHSAHRRGVGAPTHPCTLNSSCFWKNAVTIGLLEPRLGEPMNVVKLLQMLRALLAKLA